MTYEPPHPERPKAEISPKSALVDSNTRVEFSTSGSRSGIGQDLEIEWRVSGLPLNEAPTGRCFEEGSLLACRFALPGTFAVSVKVMDNNGLSDAASSSITVNIPNGYFGMLMDFGTKDARNAILYDIDWVVLQSIIVLPIVFIDRGTNLPFYPALVDNPADFGEIPTWRGGANGLKVGLPNLPDAALEAFRSAFLSIGAVPITMGVSDISAAQTAGSIDAGFVRLDSPEMLKSNAE